MKHIFDKSFKYTQAKDTDAAYLRKKFRDIFDAREKAGDAPPKISQIKTRIKAKT